jgi:hypothetical protein
VRLITGTAFALATLAGLVTATAAPALAVSPAATGAVHRADGPGGGPGGGHDCNPFASHNCQGDGGTAPPVDKHHRR